MAKKWHSTTHPISDIRDWNEGGTLIVQPDYQRREVWGDSAKVMLIDSIISGIPMPKIFVSSLVKDGRTYRTVIDGQQRITTILSFLADGFSLATPYVGEFLGKRFSELPEALRDEVILPYDIDFNEAKGLTEAELREVYSRVNKYLVALNRQELRKADFPGDFLKLAEELANLEYFEDAGIFNATARRRSLDVEYVSELLCGLLLGISDRKDAIDYCCQTYKSWDTVEKESVSTEFKAVIKDIDKLFETSYAPIKKTRWKQKADFYSLFFAISNLKREGFSLPANVMLLREDLTLLDERIAPTADVPILSKYAVYCVSQANSTASRTWRTNFLQAILRGTYAGSISDEEQREAIFTLAADIRFSVEPEWSGDGCPPVNEFICPVCKKVEYESDVASSALVWESGTAAFQISNAKWAHLECLNDVANFVIIPGNEFASPDDLDDQ
jgi:Protein of unknown function DUF262